MIFPNLETEAVVRVGDKTRISGVKSFVSKDNDPVTLVRIRANATAPWVTVTGIGTSVNDWYIDWQYADGDAGLAEIEITAGTTVTLTKNIEVVDQTLDPLWSTDSDLIGYEPDILKWVPPGRNTFLNVHRTSQQQILDWLDSIRVYKPDGSKLTKFDLQWTDDLRLLSTFYTLKNIFMGLSNKPDDVFKQKADDYDALSKSVQMRGRIQADMNEDENISDAERVDIRSTKLVRR